MIMTYLLIAMFAYLMGSIPFGLLLTGMAGLGDIRAIGSGNIGATNVLRTGKKGLALATLLLDGGKGFLAVVWIQHYGHGGVALAAIAVFLGHLYPIWLSFKGGKGVATGFGVLLAISWPVGAIACAAWLLTAVLLRYSSLAALIAYLAAPAAMWLFTCSWSTGVLEAPGQYCAADERRGAADRQEDGGLVYRPSGLRVSPPPGHGRAADGAA
jgi:glycerol-3-phosphate acyltransferase PlsY